jgi:hypothetical protein
MEVSQYAVNTRRVHVIWLESLLTHNPVELHWRCLCHIHGVGNNHRCVPSLRTSLLGIRVKPMRHSVVVNFFVVAAQWT